MFAVTTPGRIFYVQVSLFYSFFVLFYIFLFPSVKKKRRWVIGWQPSICYHNFRNPMERQFSRTHSPPLIHSQLMMMMIPMKQMITLPRKGCLNPNWMVGTVTCTLHYVVFLLLHLVFVTFAAVSYTQWPFTYAFITNLCTLSYFHSR